VDGFRHVADRTGDSGMSDTPFPAYSFLEVAAAEARAASRRYWVKGGVADRKHPVAADIERMWPLAGDLQPESDVPQRKPGRKWLSKKPARDDEGNASGV
jgi:hypothetical protein